MTSAIPPPLDVCVSSQVPFSEWLWCCGVAVISFRGVPSFFSSYISYPAKEPSPKQMALPDHYGTLNVALSSAAADIKRANHQLALKHYPDKNAAGNGDAFKQVQAAYHVLSDVTQRLRYDHQLTLARRNSGHPYATTRPASKIFHLTFTTTKSCERRTKSKNNKF